MIKISSIYIDLLNGPFEIKKNYFAPRNEVSLLEKNIQVFMERFTLNLVFRCVRNSKLRIGFCRFNMADQYSRQKQFLLEVSYFGIVYSVDCQYLFGFRMSIKIQYSGPNIWF